jgi:putative oxidoreductase
VPLFAAAATGVEFLTALGLLIGWRLKLFAWASALLSGSFFVTMWIAGGPKGPLDFSVFTVSAASLLLASRSEQARA